MPMYRGQGVLGGGGGGHTPTPSQVHIRVVLTLKTVWSVPVLTHTQDVEVIQLCETLLKEPFCVK